MNCNIDNTYLNLQYYFAISMEEAFVILLLDKFYNSKNNVKNAVSVAGMIIYHSFRKRKHNGSRKVFEAK